MKDEARRRYPEEACGYLLGRPAADGAREVLEARPAVNRRSLERERRFLLDPETVLRAEDEAEAQGMEVVGFFHSHPDHHAIPSDFDREHAWPWYSYPIVPVANGETGRLRSWRLRDDRSGFVEESVEMEPPTDETEPARRGKAPRLSRRTA